MVKAVVISLAIVFMVVPGLYSQNEEITFTTYYPSPYGSYRELDTNRLRIGNPSIPVSADGVVRFNPINLTGACNEGEMYYDSAAHSFKYCDNSGAWKTFGNVKTLRGSLSTMGSVATCVPNCTPMIGYVNPCCLHRVTFTSPFTYIPSIKIYYHGFAIGSPPGDSGYSDFEATSEMSSGTYWGMYVRDVSNTGFELVQWNTWPPLDVYWVAIGE